VRILLFGPRGYISGHLLRKFPDAVSSTADIADASAVIAALESHTPDVVINAVGKTGTPNVDWCEDHKEETFRSNVLGPLVLAEECRKRGMYMVHISSGCIYTGDNGGKGFSEDDVPNFQGSYYSRTKQWVEAMLREFSDPVEGRGGILMLRIRMPFEPEDHPKNLLSKVAKFTKVIDVPNSITYVPDCVDAAAELIARRCTGIFNMVNPGPVSLYEVACMLADAQSRPHPELLTQTLAESMTKAARSNCILSTEKLLREGIVLPSAMERIRQIVHSA
jgi:dTDP-4-dehydrorhamnose reductase